MKLTINVIMMLLLFVCSATISAQTNEKGYMVAGTVMDEKGETIIGASITVDKDRSKGTATDLDGKFRLQGLFKGEVLTVTFIGYKPYSYKVTMSKENIKIVLEPQVSDLWRLSLWARKPEEDFPYGCGYHYRACGIRCAGYFCIQYAGW